MKIIFTDSFKKNLIKLWSISENDIINLIKKYPNTTNLITIDNIESSKILKWYLYSKKVRILILFEYIKWKFIPVSIVKKETSKWQNIMKENYIELFWGDIDRVIIDYDNENYQEIEI